MVLRLHVQLEGAFPPVWRRIEVASDLGLDDLHAVLREPGASWTKIGNELGTSGEAARRRYGDKVDA